MALVVPGGSGPLVGGLAVTWASGGDSRAWLPSPLRRPVGTRWFPTALGVPLVAIGAPVAALGLPLTLSQIPRGALAVAVYYGPGTLCADERTGIGDDRGRIAGPDPGDDPASADWNVDPRSSLVLLDSAVLRSSLQSRFVCTGTVSLDSSGPTAPVAPRR
jgi:hypothetical protein